MRRITGLFCLLSAATTLPAQVPPQFAARVLPGFVIPIATDMVDGDFDGDGDRDFAVVTPFGPRLYRNDGGETLVDITAALPLLPGNQRSACFVDIDGDGRHELLLSWTADVRLFRCLVGGAWVDISSNLPPQLPTVHSAKARDLDGDGDQDIVCAGHMIDFGRNQLLINDGFGTFTVTEPFPGAAFQVDVADLDGDGDLDLLLTRAGARLWRNDGGLSFTDVTSSQMPTAPASLTAATIGDVDGDGAIDVLFGGTAQGDRWLRNNGVGTFSPASGTLPQGLGGTLSMVLADIDGDGDLDLCSGTANFGSPVVSLNDGTGSFGWAPERLPPVQSWASTFRTADLDGDGDQELLLCGLGTPPAVLWNLHRHLSIVVPPVIGNQCVIELASQPGYGPTLRVGLLAIGLRPLSPAVHLAPFGRLGLDPTWPLALTATVFQPTDGPQQLAIPVPPLPGIIGVTVHLQGLIEDSPGLQNMRFTATSAATIH